MLDVSSALGLLMCGLCLLVAYRHGIRQGRLALIDWSLLAMGGVYGAGYCLVLQATRAGYNPLWADYFKPFAGLYILHNVASFLLVLGTIFGWGLASKFQWSRNRAAPLAGYSMTPITLEVGFWVILAIGVASMIIYSMPYGGLVASLDYSRLIRSALFANVEINPYSYLQPFGKLTLLAAFGFYGLILGRRRATVTILAGFILSLAAGAFFVYSKQGRVGILAWLLVFALSRALHSQMPPKRLLFFLGALASLGLPLLFNISAWLNLKPADNLLSFMAKEIAFPFASFFAQLQDGQNLFRCFYDFVVAPSFLLPSSIWQYWIDAIGQLNTTIIIGAPKGFGQTTAVPVDIITLGLMQFHLPGVMIVSAMWGFLLRTLQSGVDAIGHPGVRAATEAYLIVYIAILVLYYAQPEIVVRANVPVLLTILVLWATRTCFKFRVTTSVV